MSDPKAERCEVKSITLDPRVEKEVAVATVQIGGLQIRGVRIYASKAGKTPRVYLPSLKENGSWVDAVVLPDQLRQEMEAKVLEAYEQQKAKGAERAEQCEVHSRGTLR
jgi:hypothetical protein